jgi:carboxymethylenebutenolidase
LFAAGQSLAIITPDGTFQGYMARPAILPAPVIIVLQEIFGVNEDLRATCDELAAVGFIAIAPDLFWRQEPGLSLSHWTDAEWKKGLALYAAYNLEQGVGDVIATVGVARDVEGSTGQVGIMGFCLGGLMTFMTAQRGGIQAAVEYYGGGTENHLQDAKSISCPMLIHLGTEDEFISKDAQRAIAEAVADNSWVTVYSYPGCSHAFARHTGAHYDSAAATLANGRTLTHFKQHLR